MIKKNEQAKVHVESKHSGKAFDVCFCTVHHTVLYHALQFRLVALFFITTFSVIRTFSALFFKSIFIFDYTMSLKRK